MKPDLCACVGIFLQGETDEEGPGLATTKHMEVDATTDAHNSWRWQQLQLLTLLTLDH